MEDIGITEEDLLTEYDDFLRVFEAMDHPCRMCPTVDMLKMGIKIFVRERVNQQLIAGVEHEIASAFYEEASNHLGLNVDTDDIKRNIGKLIDKDIEEIEQELEEIRLSLKYITDNCEGIVSLMTNDSKRMIGVICCGSEKAPAGDNLLETAYITRHSL